MGTSHLSRVERAAREPEAKDADRFVCLVSLLNESGYFAALVNEWLVYRQTSRGSAPLHEWRKVIDAIRRAA